MRRLLAHRDGVALMLTLLMGSGAMCPSCGHGTRVTSKRWARCKACGKRVSRRARDDVANEIKANESRRPAQEG